MKLALVLVFLAFLGLNVVIVLKVLKSTHTLYERSYIVNYRTVREFRNDGFQALGGAIGGVIFIYIFTRVVMFFGDKPATNIAATLEVLEFLALMFCVAMNVFLVASKEYIQMPEDETEMSATYTPAHLE